MLPPWHLVLELPAVNTGDETVGVVVIVWVAFRGPLQPAALAVIIDVPFQPAIKVTTPVPVLIVLPAVTLAPSRL